MYEGRFTAFHFYTSHKLSLNVCTSSPSSVPFLSWIKSNNVPPGAYSITIISDLSSTKLSKYAIMFGCFNLSRMSISFIAAFRSSFWSSSTVICLITIKLLSTFRLQRNTLLCVCVYTSMSECVCMCEEKRFYDSHFIWCPPFHIHKHNPLLTQRLPDRSP